MAEEAGRHAVCDSVTVGSSAHDTVLVTAQWGLEI